MANSNTTAPNPIIKLWNFAAIAVMLLVSFAITSTKIIPIWLAACLIALIGVIAATLLIIGIANFAKIPQKKAYKIILLIALGIIVVTNALYIARCV